MVGKKLWDSFKLVSGMITPPTLPSDSKISGLQDFTFPLLDGSILRLKDMAGQVVLVVNTASNCGFTPHYEKLEQLWQQYRQQGFLILGIPSNNFAGQEPDSNQHIANFCQTNFHVTFPVTTKQEVTGQHAHLLYQWLYHQLGKKGCPKWNFHKFLFDRHGRVRASWSALTNPANAVVRKKIEELLKEK
ncbi:MAG TPA: glutathione peroxidase [Alphaproteobacteria bacterium]|nr:glutathione peroxidase [Alphaproteobacteria bacterium]